MSSEEAKPAAEEATKSEGKTAKPFLDPRKVRFWHFIKSKADIWIGLLL